MSATILAATYLSSCSTESEPLNVILIDVDTLRYDHLGINDPRFEFSPNIDRWARKGVTFQRAYAAAPWTVPAQNSIMTSLYPSQHGEGGRYQFCEADEIKGLADYLKEAGYATASFTETPVKFFSQGFDLATTLPEADYFTFDEPLRWLREESRRPFFMLVHTMEVHDYMFKDPHALEPARERFPNYDRPWLTEDVRSAVVHWPLILNAGAEDIAFIQRMYQEEIRYFDLQFGKFMSDLEASGLAENTIVILTSDHGEGFDPGAKRILHGGRLHDDLVHVPLLWAGPTLPQGVSVGRPVSTIDVAPTVLSLLKLAQPAAMMGTPLFKTVPPTLWRRSYSEVADLRSMPLLFEETVFAIDDDGIRIPMNRDIQRHQVDILGIRFGGRKYIHTNAKLARESGRVAVIEREELYDLIQDPRETRNIEEEETRRRLGSALERFRSGLRRTCAGEDVDRESLDPELVETLESLGYIQ